MPSKISGITIWADRVDLIPVLQFSQTLEVGHCVPEGSERSRVAGNVPTVLLLCWKSRQIRQCFLSTWMSFVLFCDLAG